VDWQQVLVGLAVLVATAYLARQAWGARRRKCAGGCGCATGEKGAPGKGAGLISAEQLTARLRQGRG
jgi:hypothetical protein